ncbi:MAG TPA: response regulator [Bacteroidia bacterium]|jgi:DNA-binding NtrC family response regulator|nr:response regulator [Bacteroidia bacterium]
MKIALFENELHKVEVQFDICNKVFFKDSLEINTFTNSQVFGDINEISNYDLAIIDISLSSHSDKDGYNLIAQILKLQKQPKLLILTGSGNIQSGLEERKLPFIPIMEKPVDAVDIANKIKEVMKTK